MLRKEVFFIFLLLVISFAAHAQIIDSVERARLLQRAADRKHNNDSVWSDPEHIKEQKAEMAARKKMIDSTVYAHTGDSAYVRDARALKIWSGAIASYHKNGVKLLKIDEYKNIGIDIVKESQRVWYTIEGSVIIADNIFIGKVIKKEINANTKPVPHATYTIEIKSTLKGHPAKSMIIEMWAANYASDITYSNVYTVGQKIIICTNPLDTLPEKKNSEDTITINAAWAEREDDEKHIVSTQRITNIFTIKKGVVYKYEWKTGTALRVVKRMIAKYLEINK